jgi:dephospho-CoA kinase
MIIGLTGTSCSGKNHIASILEARGLPVLDVDKLGYKALDMEKEAVCAQFGTSDRHLLGQQVFGNPDKLAALEAIVHPPVNRMTDEWIGKNTADGKHCVINAALLHRSSAFQRLGCIILVKAPLITRLLRAKRRDKLPWKAIFKRFASQKNFNSQYLSINAEIYIVENPGSTGSRKLESRIDKILERIS